MVEYRRRLSIDTVIPTPAPSATVVPTALGYVNLGLPSELNVDDEDDMSWPEPSMEGQSIDEEYSSYNSTHRSKMDVDLLSYWEVRLPSFVIFPSKRKDRAAGNYIQLSLPSQWTISQCRLPLSHVNGPSHLVQKQIRRGAIGSVLC